MIRPYRVPLIVFRKIFERIVNFILLKVENINYSTYPKINGIILFNNQGRINFNGKVYLNSGSRYNMIGGDAKLSLWTSSKGIINIGDNSGISNSALVSFKSISIGKNVLIGGGVKIYDTDFHSVHFASRKIGLERQGEVVSKSVLICDNVFIGAHSIVLKGVTIGENSVIGSGSVVTKDIPPNEIWGGNPAVFLRKIA